MNNPNLDHLSDKRFSAHRHHLVDQFMKQFKWVFEDVLHLDAEYGVWGTFEKVHRLPFDKYVMTVYDGFEVHAVPMETPTRSGMDLWVRYPNQKVQCFEFHTWDFSLARKAMYLLLDDLPDRLRDRLRHLEGGPAEAFDDIWWDILNNPLCDRFYWLEPDKK